MLILSAGMGGGIQYAVSHLPSKAVQEGSIMLWFIITDELSIFSSVEASGNIY